MENPRQVPYVVLAIVVVLLPLFATGQTSDPLVGTWNFVELQDGSTVAIGLMNFNAGGTAIEACTAGSNPSSSPGESQDFGSWQRQGAGKYSFKLENFIYDASGNLSTLAAGQCTLKLANDSRTFAGSCSFNFYSCSLDQCPGQLQVGPVSENISGTRF